MEALLAGLPDECMVVMCRLGTCKKIHHMHATTFTA